MKFIFACVLFALAISAAYSAVVPYPYEFSGTYTAPAGDAAAYNFASFNYGAGYYNGAAGYYNGGYYAPGGSAAYYAIANA